MDLRYPPFDAIWYGEALHKRDLGRLLCNDLFVGVDKSWLEQHRQLFARSAVGPRTTILYRGDEAQRVYLILRGRVVATGHSTESTLRAGQFFAEAALFGRIVVRQMTTGSTCELASISSSSLRYLISEHAVIATNIARSVSLYFEHL